MAERNAVLIVGAGPAGLAAAIEARRVGLDVTVLDRRRPPIDAACGEGLMPAGVERLLGLGVRILGSESAMFHGVRYLDGEVVAEARFSASAGLGIRRTGLHRALLERVEELGVEPRWGTTARSFDGSGVDTDCGRFEADWIVAADGRLSRMRQWAGIATTRRGRSRFGVRRHFRLRPWADVVEVFWTDQGEAYVTPVGPETVGVAILSARRPLDFDRELGHFPALAARLDGAPVVSKDRGAGPFGHRPETVVKGRLALIGDASGSLDPITGEGVSVAIGQARALVRAIRGGALDDYRADHGRIMRLPRLLTNLLLRAEGRPGIRRRLIKVLAASPRLFSRAVDMVGRSGMAGGFASFNPSWRSTTLSS
jgi:flavin-dependent dehydrogenase